MLRNIALALASTLFALLLLESAARVELVPLPEFVSTDAWWKERWFRKRQGLNPRAFVALDPELGYVPAPDLDRLEYRGNRISTNSAHMRGRREYSRERGGATRIAVVGDSYTFGECAEDRETFPAVLERALPGAEVLNLGVMGYGQDQALLRLRRDGFAHQPDIAVFGFHMTDMSRNTLAFRGYGKPRFRLTEGGLELENVPVPQPEDYDVLWPPRLWNFVEIFRASRIDPKLRKREERKLSVAIVHQMALDAQEQGIPLVVVHLPHPGTLDKKGVHGWKFMDQLCDGEKPAPFLCVSPVPRFREIADTPAKVSKHFACHFSPQLYRAVGEVVAQALLDEFPELFQESRES